MGTKRRYSITKDKRRINDSFLMNIVGNNGGGQFGDSLHYFPEIRPTNDWSIAGSFSLKQDPALGFFSVFMDTRREENTINGLVIFINSNGFNFNTGWFSSLKLWAYTFKVNSIYNFSFIEIDMCIKVIFSPLKVSHLLITL